MARKEGADIRKQYLLRFLFRLLVLAAFIVLAWLRPRSFEVLDPGGFLSRPSLLHVFWLIWMADMTTKLIPSRGLISLGAQKQFSRHFQPVQNEQRRRRLADLRRESNIGALKVLIIWVLLTVALGFLYRHELLTARLLLIVCVLFYVCDLICVLFWCPFQRLIMKNRCCITCRIYNWDHLMMFSPLIFLPGSFGRSLFFMALAVFIVWEYRFHRYPHYFFDETNAALGCGSCGERLCGGKYVKSE